MDEKQGLSVYLKLLEDILLKKKKALQSILRLTKEQDKILSEKEFDDDSFNTAIEGKEKEIETLNHLDSGFTKIFEVVSEHIEEEGAAHKAEIEKLQSLIPEVTSLSAEIQALEKKNKDSMERKLTEIRSGVRKFNVSKQTADKYYKNMTKLNTANPCFFDTKE